MARVHSVMRGALVALVLVGCSSAASPAPAPTTDPPAAPAAASVLLVGDSIMRELAGPVTAAVEAGGQDHATFALGPALPRTGSDLVGWRRAIEQADPDVVVLHIGGWERLKVLGDFATGLRLEAGTYRSEVIDPALALVQDAGATLLWVSPLPVRDAEKTAFVGALAEDWQAALAGRSDATWLDVAPVIAPSGYTDSLPGPDGRPQLVRRSDGIHLCPAGQRRVATAIVEHLAPLLTAPPPAGWDVAWRRGVHEPGGCAPYQPPASG